MVEIEETRERIRISVRNLVEFILRSGDIDNRRTAGEKKEAMQEGSRIHRKIQGRMGSTYRAEVPLKILLNEGEYDLSIEGRADGIDEISDTKVVIDEIKGIYLELSYLEEAIPVHMAQAKCYAYIYAREAALDAITVQVTYCNLESEEIKRFKETYAFKELEDWFLDLVGEYKKWADFQFQWRKIRNDSIQGLPFPHPYREGQDELVKNVYRTILRKKNLFIQAPTGAGKTISTVYPCVMAVGQGLAEKIFYLTAKTITRTVAKESFDLLKTKGYQGKVVTVTAKEKICPLDEMECNPVSCPYAKGHYDRVNDAVYELITSENDFTRERITEHASKHQVCPFEMCLDMTTWSDVIICDYNYVFDPNVYLKRFFGESVKGEYLFLIDEAHNLVDRGREMYSASLYKESFLEMKKIFKLHSKKIEKCLEKCNKQMLEYKRECEKYMVYDNFGKFVFDLMRLFSYLDTFLQKTPEFPNRDGVVEFYLQLRHFLNMFELIDENYVLYTQHTEDGRFQLKLFCVNPAVNLQAAIDKSVSTVFFSATLLPIHYYKELLSTEEDNYAVYAKTAFTKEQSLLMIAQDVSSKYTRRNEQEYRKIATYIHKIIHGKKGNYMVFFPSYRFMEEVWDIFLEINGNGGDCIIQEMGMGEEEREIFLQEFSREREKSLVGFCVMGGIFSEGIDLKEEQLIGAIIVGTGLPQIGNERDILKNFYEEKHGDGFDYAFRYPGMNKVLQSAGRVIRTVSDKGVIVLLDERFLQREYSRLFPREWEEYERVSLENVEEKMDAFWKGQ